MNISQERDWRFYTFGSILLIFLLAFQLIIELGGTSHGESNCFMLLYNFTPNLLKTVFDPLRTDWNLYQSRELSYFIDAIDARFTQARRIHTVQLTVLALKWQSTW